MMITPPSSPRSPIGTPFGSPVRFDFESPVSIRQAFSFAQSPNQSKSPFKKRFNENPPPAPRKRKSVEIVVEGVYQGKPNGTPPPGNKIGEGSFCSVYECKTPDGSVVLKKTPIGGKSNKLIPLKEVNEEVRAYGTPGCIHGVPYQNGDVLEAIVPWANPLNKLVIEQPELLKQLWNMIEEAIMVAPIGVVVDCKPENMGYIPAGSIYPVLVDGSIKWSKTEEEMVVFIDLNHISGDGDGNWALFVEDPSDEMLRNFKVEIMRQWIENPEELFCSRKDCGKCNVCRNFRLNRRQRVEEMFR